MNSFTYQIKKSLYLNITNRCTNECPFCIRNKSRLFNGKYKLWLDKEPSAEEILEAIGDPSRYQEIVFCGYGEPLIRLDLVKTIAAKIKATPKPKTPIIRIDTNGAANLFWGRNILPELKGLIDFISISLNAQNSQLYKKLCRPIFGEKTYAAILDFIKEAKKYIPKVEVTIVNLPNVDKNACQKIAQELGVDFRIRSYYEKKYKR